MMIEGIYIHQRLTPKEICDEFLNPKNGMKPLFGDSLKDEIAQIMLHANPRMNPTSTETLNLSICMEKLRFPILEEILIIPLDVLARILYDAIRSYAREHYNVPQDGS